jgi:hypothetical protein
MKLILAMISLSMPVWSALAQGKVGFFNTPTTLVSAGPAGQQGLISGPRGSYYFGLFIAPTGSADSSQFAFTGFYATNVGAASPGRLTGGSFAVPGWAPGTTKSYLVAGWSSSLGHDWDQQWMSGTFSAAGYFGLSDIGSGVAGGPAGGIPAADWPLFGPVGGTWITTGWNLDPVPEPSAAAVLAIGAATLLIYYRYPKERRNRSSLAG